MQESGLVVWLTSFMSKAKEIKTERWSRLRNLLLWGQLAKEHHKSMYKTNSSLTWCIQYLSLGFSAKLACSHWRPSSEFFFSYMCNPCMHNAKKSPFMTAKNRLAQLDHCKGRHWESTWPSRYSKFLPWAARHPIAGLRLKLFTHLSTMFWGWWV